MSSVILGTDVETGDAVRIGDVERRSGLYILGRPGMGKSALMVNMHSRFAHFFRGSEDFNLLNFRGLCDYPIFEES
jgi:replicative DNA helicase